MGICSIACTEDKDCKAAVFNLTEPQCTLYEAKIMNETTAAHPNNLFYLVSIQFIKALLSRFVRYAYNYADKSLVTPLKLY